MNADVEAALEELRRSTAVLIRSDKDDLVSDVALAWSLECAEANVGCVTTERLVAFGIWVSNYYDGEWIRPSAYFDRL